MIMKTLGAVVLAGLLCISAACGSTGSTGSTGSGDGDGQPAPQPSASYPTPSPAETRPDPYEVYLDLAPADAPDLSREDAQTRALLGCGQEWAPGTVDAALAEAYGYMCEGLWPGPAESEDAS